MDIVNINDIIYATVTARGKITANFQLSGLNSISDIMSAIKREIGSITGLVTISMRNMTQGWNRKKTLYFATSPIITPGTQLSLF